jgi:hypothetical protein
MPSPETTATVGSSAAHLTRGALTSPPFLMQGVVQRQQVKLRGFNKEGKLS